MPCRHFTTKPSAIVEYGDTLSDVWRKIRDQQLDLAIVTTKNGTPMGYIALSDLLSLVDEGSSVPLREQLDLCLKYSGTTHADKVEYAGQFMKPVTIVSGHILVTDLMSDCGGIFAVIDENKLYVGYVDISEV